jgi:hypothetical protein
LVTKVGAVVFSLQLIPIPRCRFKRWIVYINAPLIRSRVAWIVFVTGPINI